VYRENALPHKCDVDTQVHLVLARCATQYENILSLAFAITRLPSEKLSERRNQQVNIRDAYRSR